MLCTCGQSAILLSTMTGLNLPILKPVTSHFPPFSGKIDFLQGKLEPSDSYSLISHICTYCSPIPTQELSLLPCAASSSTYTSDPISTLFLPYHQATLMCSCVSLNGIQTSLPGPSPFLPFTTQLLWRLMVPVSILSASLFNENISHQVP